MAVIKWSVVTTGAKGKLRGSVLQFGAGGQIIRANRRSNQFSNQRWNRAKTNNSMNANLWRSLTTTEQNGWTAMTNLYPTTNRWGDTRYPSGYELFMRLNNGLLFQTGANIIPAPAPVSFTNIFPISASGSAGGPIDVTVVADWTADELVVINATPPYTNGRSVPKGRYVQIGAYDNGNYPTWDISSDYINVFGNIPSNSQIFIMARVFNVNNGQYSAKGIVAAPIT